MFAYCNNNPVNGYDPSGMATFWTSTGDVNPLLSGYYGFGGGGGVTCYRDLGAPIADFFNQAGKIINNTSEQKVLADLQSKGVSFYKGAPVFRADWMGGAALSFGIIIMGGKNLSRSDFNQTLNHEYGHIIHFTMIGAVDYFTTTATPSLIGAAISGHDSSFRRTVRDNYYNLPWERTAEYLGGVNRGYAPYADTLGSLFWIYTLIVSAATP